MEDGNGMNSKYKYPQIVSTAKVNGDIYFKAYSTPGTFVLKKDTGTIRLIPEWNNKEKWHGYMYSDCSVCGSKIIYSPYMETRYFSILNTEDETFTYIENTKGYTVGKSVVFGDDIYFFEKHPEGGRTAKININDLKLEEVSWEGDAVENLLLFNDCCQVGGCLYGPNCNSAQICSFDIRDGRAKKYSLEKNMNSTTTVAYDGEYYWISGCCDEIVVWDKDRNVIENVIEIEHHETKLEWNMRFSSSIYRDGYIYFSPICYNKIIRIDTKTAQIEELFNIDDDEVCWNICDIADDRLLFSITHPYTGATRNIVINSFGDIDENNEFMLSTLDFPDFYTTILPESKESPLEMFLNDITDGKCGGVF